MSKHKEVWLQGIYISGRDYGHELISESPYMKYIELESEIFNFLMEEDNYRKYHRAVENKAREGARRVWYVKHGVYPDHN